MSFVSFKFLLFLGVSFFAYFVVPKRHQWVVLLLFSYLYYYLCSHLLIVDLFFVSVFTYASGRIIDRIEEKKKRDLISRLSIFVVLLNLIIFKYSDFVIENIDRLLKGNVDLLHLVLPLGISYYTLQAIAYLRDIGKKKQAPETNMFHFLLYMSYFPQIVQGPIPKFKRLNEQLFVGYDFNYERICKGLQLMGWGLAKKTILADRLSVPVSYMFDNYNEFHGLFLFFAVVCYGFQIYADFSGGIDTIRGISEVFGIVLDDNFRQPYFSHSIEEFWRRWHISLGAWMKEYVFFPLSLSRNLNRIGKRLRSSIGEKAGKKFAPFTAMFIVYLLVGIWHGPDWKYVVYGLWNGLFTMSGVLFEEQYKNNRERFGIDVNSFSWKTIQILRTFIIVSIGRIISRAHHLKDAVNIIKLIAYKIFDFSLFNTEKLVSLGINMREWLLCFFAVIIILYIDYLKEKGIKIRNSISKMNIVFRWALYILLILSILIFGKYGPGYEAANFIYGNY